MFLNEAILGLGQADIRNRFDEIVEFAGLERFIDTPVKSYSSGMYVRLGFAIAVNVTPTSCSWTRSLPSATSSSSASAWPASRRCGAPGGQWCWSPTPWRRSGRCATGRSLREGGVADVGPATSVVDTYLRDVGDTSKREAGLSLAGHRYGTREVELTRVELCAAPTAARGRPSWPGGR